MSAPHDPSPSGDGPEPSSWSATVLEFIDARIALVRSEAGEARRTASRRMAALALLALGAGLGWLLLLVGLIGLIAASRDDWTWHGVTLATAAVHFAAAAVALSVLRRPAPPSFPLTREELTKDRTWLENLRNSKR